MKAALLSLGLLLTGYLVTAQSLKKYTIANTGCSAYFFCDPGVFTDELSEDSSRVLTAECMADEVSYAIICVKVSNRVEDLEEAEELLISYLDYLKEQFKITSSAGYGKGHRLNENENTRGVIDYWADNEKNEMKIKGWTDGNFVAVLYVTSKKEVPETKINLFLDGFRLPGM